MDSKSLSPNLFSDENIDDEVIKKDSTSSSSTSSLSNTEKNNVQTDNNFNENIKKDIDSPPKRKSFDSIKTLSPAKSLATNKVTETNLTSSIPTSPVKFKDSVNIFQEQINDSIDLNNNNNAKDNSGAETAKKEDFSTLFNNMFSSITGNNTAYDSTSAPTNNLNKDNDIVTHKKNRSISSSVSISSAGKSLKDLFLKDLDEIDTENLLNRDTGTTVDDDEGAKDIKDKDVETVDVYSVINSINFAKNSSNEKFHTTFKSVPNDEKLLSEVFNASLAKEKNKQKTGSFASSALSIGSALTADTNHNVPPDELVGIDGSVSHGHDKENTDESMFWFSNDYNKSEKNASAFNTNNNGELFISEKYIGFQSFKNLLNLWTTNILIYIHDIESINNAGAILINKHRANKDIRKMKENILKKSKGNENGITITTVYDKTYAFYNIPEKVLAKRTLQTIWDIHVEGMSYLTDSNERSPPILLEPSFFKSNNTNPPSRSLSNVNIRNIDTSKDLYTSSPNLLTARPSVSSKRSITNLSKVNSNNDYLLNRVSRQSSRSVEDKFLKEESEIEDEIMSIDDQIGIRYSSNKKNLAKPDSSTIDEADSSIDEKSVTTMKLSNKTFSDENAIYDESDDSFDSDDEYYNGALKLSSEEYDKKITVFDFKESSKFNYTGPLYHEDTEFLTTPELDKEEEILAELTVDCTPGQLFEIMFSEQFNNFLIDFLKDQDSSNFQPLKFGKFDKMNQEGQRYREYQYEKKLNYPVGPSTTRCMVRETILVSNPDEFYKVINSTNTPDVPSGPAFNVKTCYQLRWTDNGKCFLKVSFWIEWVKSSWIKGMVEKSCKSGQVEATKVFCDILLKYCEENIHQIEMPKGKAMRSLVFNHRLSVSSKKRVTSSGRAKSRQASTSMDDSTSKKLKSPLFKPYSPRKSPVPPKLSKVEDVTDLDLNSSSNNKTTLASDEYANILRKIEKSEKLLILQNILLFIVAVLLLLNLLRNWKYSNNWKQIYFDHFQKLILSNKENSTNFLNDNDDFALLSDKEITNKLINTIDKLISRRLEQQ